MLQNCWNELSKRTADWVEIRMTIEKHNSESIELKRGQTIGLVTSCVVTQAKKGQLPEEHKEDTQGVTGQSNDTDTHIGSASRGNQVKRGSD